MRLKNTIYYVAMFTAVLGICLSCSCKRNAGGILEDSNNFTSSLPFWEQSWKCGEWEPLKSDANGWIGVFIEPDVALSVCDNCESVRVLDFGNKKERTLLSSTSRFRPSEYKWTAGLSENQLKLSKLDAIVGEHKWIAGLNKRMFDLIEAEDIVIVQQRHYLFIFMVQNISGVALDDQEITYEVAKFSLKDKWPVRIDLSKIKWKKRKSHKALPITGRGIEFDLFPTMWTNGKPKFVEIFYDQFYGGTGGPDAVMGDDAAKIAIIHKNDMKEDSIIDFRRYRFKSWEDGLGNKCEDNKRIMDNRKE